MIRFPFRFAVALPLFCLFLSTAHAQVNRYDLVARTLRPFIDVLLEEPKLGHVGFDAELEPGPIKGAPDMVQSLRLRLVLARPDHLRVEGELAGQKVIVCRTGDRIWAWPGSLVSPLLEKAKVNSKKKYSNKPLGSWELPVPDAQAVFLPALLQVDDVAASEVDGAAARVVDIRLMPELAEGAGLEKWAARAWIRPGDFKLVKVSVRGPDWQGVLNIRKMDFMDRMPPEWWSPTAEQATDVVNIDPARYRQLVSAILESRK